MTSFLLQWNQLACMGLTLEATGDVVKAALATLMRTRKVVTSSVILAGTESGGMTKLVQEAATIRPEGM